jgi:hypothetical protein
MSGSDQDAPGTDAPAAGTDTLLTDGGEVLLRQIHPNLYLDGKIASTAFMPTADDKGELSVDRSSLTTPVASFDLYVANGRESVAVYGVSVGQFEAQGIPCHSDPLPETDKLKANPAHAYADFKGIETPKKQRQAAQRLRDRAVERSCLYTP